MTDRDSKCVDRIDAEWKKVEDDLVRFMHNGRKYVSRYPETDDEMALLYMIGDMTSVFSPFVWSDHTPTLKGKK